MSQNAFPINPIFFMPIDSEDSSNTIKEQKDKNNSFSFENNSLSSIDENEDINNKNTIIFSLNKDDRNIKSMTNSSKIYTSDIFKRNWKLKSKRLITKLKKKLIKQIKNFYKNNINECNEFNNNTNKNEHQIIINSKKNSNFDINNYYKNNLYNNIYNSLYNQNQKNNNYNDNLIDKIYNNNFIDNKFIYNKADLDLNYQTKISNNDLALLNYNNSLNNVYLIQSLVHYIKNDF